MFKKPFISSLLMMLMAVTSLADDGFRLVRTRLFINGYHLAMTTSWAVTLESTEAHIEIEEVNSAKIITRTTTIPVLVRILHRGLNLRHADARGLLCGSQGQGCADGHAAFKIMGLRNNKIKDIFGRYNGVSAGVAVFLNLGESVLMKNDSLIFINDLEEIVGGFGVNLVVRNMLILPLEGEHDNNIAINVEGLPSGVYTESVAKSLSEVLNTVVK